MPPTRRGCVRCSGPNTRSQALDSFPAAGEIHADVVISNSLSADEAARLHCRLVHVPGAGCGADRLPGVAGSARRCATCTATRCRSPSSRCTPSWSTTCSSGSTRRVLDAEAWAQSYSTRAQHDEAYGKTVAIVGFGHIGQEIARRARAFGMHVIAVTRSGKQGPAELAHEYVAVSALDEALPRTQSLVICCPLDDSTRGLIGARQLGLLPAGALLVNVARAEVVDEQALYEALSQQRLGRAVLDVWYQYPKKSQSPVPPSRWPLHELANVRATPHISAITPALLDRRYGFMARNIERLQQGQALDNVIYRAP